MRFQAEGVGGLKRGSAWRRACSSSMSLVGSRRGGTWDDERRLRSVVFTSEDMVAVAVKTRRQPSARAAVAVGGVWGTPDALALRPSGERACI